MFVSARCALKTPKLKWPHLKNYIRYRSQTSDFFFLNGRETIGIKMKKMETKVRGPLGEMTWNDPLSTLVFRLKMWLCFSVGDVLRDDHYFSGGG